MPIHWHAVHPSRVQDCLYFFNDDHIAGISSSIKWTKLILGLVLSTGASVYVKSVSGQFSWMKGPNSASDADPGDGIRQRLHIVQIKHQSPTHSGRGPLWPHSPMTAEASLRRFPITGSFFCGGRWASKSCLSTFGPKVQPTSPVSPGILRSLLEGGFLFHRVS